MTDMTPEEEFRIAKQTLSSCKETMRNLCAPKYIGKPLDLGVRKLKRYVAELKQEKKLVDKQRKDS